MDRFVRSDSISVAGLQTVRELSRLHPAQISSRGSRRPEEYDLRLVFFFNVVDDRLWERITLKCTPRTGSSSCTRRYWGTAYLTGVRILPLNRITSNSQLWIAPQVASNARL